MKQKKQKGRFPGMLAVALGVSLLGNILAGKRVARGGDGVIRAGEEVTATSEGRGRNRASQDFLCSIIV